MKDIIMSDFQNCVSDCLLRNTSILDILSKHNTSQSKAQRLITKSVTHCGCIKICGEKHDFSKAMEDKAKDTQIKGALCDECKSNIEKALGSNLFYLVALCNALELDVYDILLKEKENLQTLGNLA